jgi:hypothetical protein
MKRTVDTITSTIATAEVSLKSKIELVHEFLSNLAHHNIRGNILP